MNVGVYAWSNMNHGVVQPHVDSSQSCSISATVGNDMGAHITCETNALGGHVTTHGHYSNGEHVDPYTHHKVHDDRMDFGVGYTSPGVNAYMNAGTSASAGHFASGGATFHW